MDGTPLPPLPTLILHDVKRDDVDAGKIVQEWLDKLQERLQQKPCQHLQDLFIQECWWRDIIGLDWDFTTKRGWQDIADYINSSKHNLSELRCAETGGLKAALIEYGGCIWLQAAFSFKTAHGRGQGVVRLANVSAGEWKAWIVFTQLEQLNFQEEREQHRLAAPAARLRALDQQGAGGAAQGQDEEIQVLIVGAGQAGLMLGARLRDMGIKTVLVERSARVGDSWRARYKAVRLHTPTYTDHYPFIKYPENWPRWLPRDKVADFMETYAQIQSLHVLCNTLVSSAIYDEATRRWSVSIKTGETLQTLHARHVVLATGVYSDNASTPIFANQDEFQGQCYHSSQHVSAAEMGDLADKKIAIIGSSTSAHDVAQDFVEHGAQHVCMIQRQAIFSISSDAVEKHLFLLWNIPELNMSEADVLANSFPIALVRRMSIGLTRLMCQHDAAMVAGLKQAGLALKTGEDGYGLADHQLLKGGHFYFDQGANSMIINGRIKIWQCPDGVERFVPEGVELGDGRRVEADIVVLATGFEQSICTVEDIMGSRVARVLESRAFGALDAEQERGGWWRATGVPGFWYMTGSFMWCRQFSQALALQIAAVERGLNAEYYARNAWPQG
ncbi:hypothetical protein CDD81_475 [Ophiocordyceps australis]|uniref:FAD/NAD(P)-binding domain-containing protein n=1 Tax=Ophiocordyceps australis TaxID=1399860 RepID=A0A2C5Y375_9HYPO|nr:hypothetical protein CDD81_475 [Ophiocordyceps australis]